MEHSVQYGTTNIDFSVSRKDRKTLSIEVYPDMHVKIVAPEAASMSEIEEKILKRAAWIVKQKDYFESFLPRTPEREYISGETHYYLGRRYVLKIKTADENKVKLKAGNIIIYCKKNTQEKVRQMLMQWYYSHGERKFKEIFDTVFLRFNKFEVSRPKLEIKRMKNRWGSCTTRGKVILNPEIIKAPVKCIEYVITHEICHLIHHNHSKDFYKLLEEKMPDWKKWKKKLESLLA